MSGRNNDNNPEEYEENYEDFENSNDEANHQKEHNKESKLEKVDKDKQSESQDFNNDSPKTNIKKESDSPRVKTRENIKIEESKNNKSLKSPSSSKRTDKGKNEPEVDSNKKPTKKLSKRQIESKHLENEDLADRKVTDGNKENSSLKKSINLDKSNSHSNIDYSAYININSSVRPQYIKKPSKLDDAEALYKSLKLELDSVMELEKAKKDNNDDYDVYKKINFHYIKYLDRINNIINLVIEGSKIPIKNPNFNPPPKHYKQKKPQNNEITREVENVQNSQKIVENFRKEYEKTNTRFKQVSEDSFMENLQDLLHEINSELALEVKDNRNYKSVQQQSNAKFDKNIKNELSTKHYDLSKLNFDFNGLKKSNEALQIKIEKAKLVEEANEKKIKELMEKVAELEYIAKNDYNIAEIEERNQEDLRVKKMRDQRDTLQRKTNILEKVLNNNKKKYEERISTNEKIILQTEKKKSEISETIYIKNTKAKRLLNETKKYYSFYKPSIMPDFESNPNNYVEEAIENNSVLSEYSNHQKHIKSTHENNMRISKQEKKLKEIETEPEIEKDKAIDRSTVRTNRDPYNFISKNHIETLRNLENIENGKTQGLRSKSPELKKQKDEEIIEKIESKQSLREKKPFKMDYKKLDGSSSSGTLNNNDINSNTNNNNPTTNSTINHTKNNLIKSPNSHTSNGQSELSSKKVLKKNESEEIKEHIEEVEIEDKDNTLLGKRIKSPEVKEKKENPYVKEEKQLLFSNKKLPKLDKNKEKTEKNKNKDEIKETLNEHENVSDSPVKQNKEVKETKKFTHDKENEDGSYLKEVKDSTSLKNYNLNVNDNSNKQEHEQEDKNNDKSQNDTPTRKQKLNKESFDNNEHKEDSSSPSHDRKINDNDKLNDNHEKEDNTKNSPKKSNNENKNKENNQNDNDFEDLEEIVIN